MISFPLKALRPITMWLSILKTAILLCIASCTSSNSFAATLPNEPPERPLRNTISGVDDSKRECLPNTNRGNIVSDVQVRNLHALLPDEEAAFYDFCANRDLEGARAWLEQDSDRHVNNTISTGPWQGCSLLHIACIKSDMTAVATLLNLGADINQPVGDQGEEAGFSPLHLVCWYGYGDAQKDNNRATCARYDEQKRLFHFLLVDNTIQINASIQNNTDIPSNVFCRGHVDLADQVDKILVGRQFPKEAVNLIIEFIEYDQLLDMPLHCYTPLHLTCYLGQVGMLKALMEKLDEDNLVKATQPGSYPPLYMAYHGNQQAVIHFLKEQHEIGADMTITLSEGSEYTLLQFACKEGYVETAKVILAHGVGPYNNARIDDCFVTPLHLAAENGHEEVVCWLIIREPSLINVVSDSSNRNEAGRTALDLAYHNRHTKVVYHLFAAGSKHRLSDFRVTDHQGRTTLYWAIEARDIDTIKKLLPYMYDLSDHAMFQEDNAINAIDPQDGLSHLLVRGALYKPDKAEEVKNIIATLVSKKLDLEINQVNTKFQTPLDLLPVSHPFYNLLQQYGATTYLLKKEVHKIKQNSDKEWAHYQESLLWQELDHIYIPPQGKRIQYADTTFDLTEEIERFLHPANPEKLLLIAGYLRRW